MNQLEYLLKTFVKCSQSDGLRQYYDDLSLADTKYDSAMVFNFLCCCEEMANELLKGNITEAEKIIKSHMIITGNKDKKVSRKNFLTLYDAEMIKLDLANDLDGYVENSAVYGEDVTVHWNGYYCNCGDGATAYNNIIEGVRGVVDELDDEEER